MDQVFLEMKLSEFQRICQTLGIDIDQHHKLICEMFWDGFCAAEVAEAVELIDLKEEFSYMDEPPYVS